VVLPSSLVLAKFFPIFVSFLGYFLLRFFEKLLNICCSLLSLHDGGHHDGHCVQIRFFVFFFITFFLFLFFINVQVTTPSFCNKTFFLL
jgi:hypothetical protein